MFNSLRLYLILKSLRSFSNSSLPMPTIHAIQKFGNDQRAHQFQLCTEHRKGHSFPIFIRKEIETRKLERKSKQKISRLIDLLYRLNDTITR